MQYLVMRGKSMDLIEANVEAALEEGWSLQGGLYVLRLMFGFKTHYFQAMIKSN